MTVPIAFELDIGAALEGVLRRAHEAATDLTPAMKEIAEHLRADTILRFETETDPAGVPWIPAKKKEDNPALLTLNLEGHLKGSIEEEHGPAHAAVGVSASGPAVKYAAIHQFGGPMTPRGMKGQSFAARYFMPARPYLGFTDLNAVFALDAIEEHLGLGEGGVQ